MDDLIRDIPEFPNYQVSISGTVYNKTTGNELKWLEHPNREGVIYYRVHFSHKSKGYQRRVHRVVASTFLDNPDNLTEVDHIDGNPSNNHVDNLRWCSRSQNQTNKKTQKNNTLGYKNIKKEVKKQGDKEYKYYKFELRNHNIQKRFPYTDEGLQQAIQYAELKRIELFGDFANHGN